MRVSGYDTLKFFYLHLYYFELYVFCFSRRLLGEAYLEGAGYDTFDNINSVVDNYLRRDTRR